ncbi:DUF3013 family protein [Lactococcus fujiensis]|uniref:DUF3013 family protein n=1 Tax=Lactococcus fujiensis JCM 16395 TaxID=1291764 RepID=A0A2A5RLM9_9LACT|nr:DUF3013 family protein [Lactococcus fujiensis]PCS00202.1 hypothetical protein RT41_GL001513 [Lactococcus fujiensis JCM 16395]
MAKYGFLDVIQDTLEEKFNYDFEMNWDKRNFAVEVNFLLEVENKAGIALTDADGVESAENIEYEDSVIFYNPQKSHFDADEYLAAIPYTDKGLSGEFLTFFVEFLQETADEGLDDLIDFLDDDEAEEFSINWDKEKFDEGVSALTATEFYKYPRY